MQVRTLVELIEWTRSLHENPAQCLSHCASRHTDERASWMLGYLATHEAEMQVMVAAFKQQADPKAANTLVYHYIPHKPVTAHLECDDHYTKLDSAEISSEFFSREQIIDLYRTLLRNAVIPEAEELMQALLDMEVNETKLLAKQIGRMADL